jgi:hypothetical protein
MALAVSRHQYDTLADDDTRPSREKVLGRYRHLRAISRQHHNEMFNLISGDALQRQARRLGLMEGKTIVLDDLEAMNYVYDLAIHTAEPGRSRAVDRYARSARLVPGSDEARVLEAMQAARFSILCIERRHEAAGLIATDLLRGGEVWLVDIGLESSMPDGSMMATRLYTPERFSMAAGVNVPFDLGLLEDISAEMPQRLRENSPAALSDNRHFAETIYRVALAGGIMNRVAYQDLPDDV